MTPLFSMRLNETLKERLRVIADKENRSLSYIIDKALTIYADDNGDPAAYPGAGGYLYVMLTQSGAVKFGITKNVARRLSQHNKYPRNKNNQLSLVWASDFVANVAKIERNLKLEFGVKHRGVASGETINAPPEAVVAVAKRLCAP